MQLVAVPQLRPFVVADDVHFTPMALNDGSLLCNRDPSFKAWGMARCVRYRQRAHLAIPHAFIAVSDAQSQLLIRQSRHAHSGVQAPSGVLIFRSRVVELKQAMDGLGGLRVQLL